MTPDDNRRTADLAVGEIVHNAVHLDVEGAEMTFDVRLRAKVLDHFDASMLAGDESLTELLRFQPATLNAVLSAVGKVRRGAAIQFPIEEGSTDAPQSSQVGQRV